MRGPLGVPAEVCALVPKPLTQYHGVCTGLMARNITAISLRLGRNGNTPDSWETAEITLIWLIFVLKDLSLQLKFIWLPKRS